MKILIVGFGKMGMLHGATLKALRPEAELVVCDRSSLIGAGLRQFVPAARFYTDLDEALEKEAVTLAVVATPNHAHLSVFEKLIRRGIHVLVEKPFVTDFEEARLAQGWADGAQGAAPKVMVGYCLRFVQTFETAKALLDQKALGRILNFRAQMFSSDVERPQKGWRFSKSQKGGGVLLDLGSHVVDLVRDLFGMPGSVTALAQSLCSRDVEDHVGATFFYEGFDGSFEVCWSVDGVRKPQAEISVCGTNGTLEVCNDEIVFDLRSPAGSYPAGRYRRDITQLARPVGFDLAGPFYTDQMTQWLEAIGTGGVHRNTLAESLDNHFLIDLMKESRGRRLEVRAPGRQ